MGWISVAQLIAALSILVILHELGHFIPAKWFKCRVEKFYLFFDAYFSLFKFKKGETEYGIGWLPLGGYVKISGMVDESLDMEQLKEPPKPYEFRSKPAWQRLIIMLGGVTVNLLLGLFLFMMILWYYGEKYIPTSSVTYGIATDSLGRQLGLEDGDLVLKVGNTTLDKFNDRMIIKEIVINNANTLTVKRNGAEQTITIPEGSASIFTNPANKSKALFVPRIPAVIDSVIAEKPAGKAGFKKGDRIVAVNDSTTLYQHQFTKKVKSSKSDSLHVSVFRDEKDTVILSLLPDSSGTIGVFFNPERYLKTETTKYGFFESIPKGISKGWNALGDQIKAFGQIFKGRIKLSESLGGPIAIASTYGNVWIWERFWNMTALLSLILAFMNLLPIPALDGGHVLFLLYELITGKKPSDKFLEVATTIGFILLMGLMLYAFGSDIYKLIKGTL